MKFIKTITDPVLKAIKVEDELIWELIQSREFIRLGNIKQLGFASFVYPGATHTRRAHSLGVYELARRLLETLDYDVEPKLKRAILAAALLHDIGHGPFSHQFEKVTGIEHETYTTMIINSEESEINKILSKEEGLVELVTDIIEPKGEKKFYHQIISSAIDVDRADYLVRDSYYTGTSYGYVDLDWLFRNTRVIEDKLVFDVKNVQVIEKFLIGRHQLNQTVYFHPKNVDAESTFVKLFDELFDFMRDGELEELLFPQLIKMMNKERMTYEEFITLDDSLIWALFHKLAKLEDSKFASLKEKADKLLRGKLVRVPQEEIKGKAFMDDESRNIQILIPNNEGSYEIKKITELSDLLK